VRTEDRIQTTTGRRQNYFQGTSYYCDIAMNFNMSSGYVPTFLHAVDSFKAINGLRIKWQNEYKMVKAGQTIKVILQLSNPMDYSIKGDKIFMNYTFFKSKADHKTSDNIPLKEELLAPGFKKDIEIKLVLPTIPGKYKLIFSFDQPYLGPTFASPFYEIEVK
jgi:hypothetical protein